MAPIPWFVPYILMAASFALSLLLRPKKRSPLPYVANSWDQQTCQRAGIPVELVYGTAKVTGNAFSQHTDIVNTTGGTTNWLLDLIRLQFDWGALQTMEVVTLSKQVLNVRLGFGDGPVVGLQVTKTLLNSIPLAQLPDVSSYERLGTDSQTATGMEDILEFPHRQEVVMGTPVTVEMTDSDYDDVALILTSQDGLLSYGQSTGKPLDQMIVVKVEVRIAGGSWQTLYEGCLFGRTVNPIYWRFVASETYDGGTPFIVTPGDRHEWRVTNTWQSTSSRSQGKLEVWSLQEIYNTNYRFPGLSFLEIRALPSNNLNGNLQMEGILDGKIVEDVETEELAWSDNPANVIRDLLCRPCIRGDGSTGDPYEVEYYRGRDPSELYTADFQAMKDWCDDLVDDGKGSTEKRFRFCGRFSEQTERWAQAAKVAAMCRATLWYDGVRVRVWIDKVTTASHLFCCANMFVPYEGGQATLPDSGYKEWSVDPRKVPGAIEAEITNEAANYEISRIKKVDPLAVSGHIEQMDGFGIPSVSQFVRTADFVFAKQKNKIKMCQFTTDVNGLDVKIGDVAYIQFNGNKRGTGACVVEVLAADVVVIDMPVSMESGVEYSLVIQTVDAEGKHVEVYTVDYVTETTAGDNHITVGVTASFGYTPAAGDYVIFAKTEELDQYRIVGVKYDLDGRCEFVAEQYLAAYYESDGATPDYDTNLYLAQPTKGGSTWQPVSRQDLLSVVNEERVYAGDTLAQPTSGDITFTGDEVSAVFWEGGDDVFGVGWLRYNGQDYPIYSSPTGGSTAKYIYFDPAEGTGLDPTHLYETDDLADLRGYTRFLGCINVNGRPFPKGWVLVGKDSALDINSDDITQGVFGTKAMQETFEDPDDDVGIRWVNYTGAVEMVTMDGGVSGGRFLRVGNNSGDDMAFLVYGRSLIFDPGLLYRVRFRVRQTSGDSGVVFYAGLAGRDGADAAWVNVVGVDTLGSQHYVAASGDVAPSTWTDYVGYVRGTGPEGDAIPHPDPQDPGVMHENVRWVRAMIVCNFENCSGEFDIDTVAVDVITDAGAMGTGTMAFQDADDVAITGGTISGVTLVDPVFGTGTDFGLGTMAYQDADAVDITGGEATGLSVVGTQAAHFTAEYDNGECSGAAEVDWNEGNRQALALTGDVTLSFVDPPGAANLILRVVQDGVGGHALILPAGTLMANGTVLADLIDDAADAETILTLYWPDTGTGCVYRCAAQGFSEPA